MIDPPPAIVREACPWHELEQAPASCGDDGRRLLEQFLSVRRRWMEPSSLKSIFAEDFISDEFDDEIDESVDVVHVPFETVGTIRVRFKEATPMKPRCLDFDEDNE